MRSKHRYNFPALETRGFKELTHIKKYYLLKKFNIWYAAITGEWFKKAMKFYNMMYMLHSDIFSYFKNAKD